MFVNEHIGAVKASHPELVRGSKLSAFCGKMWNGLSVEEKQKYVDKEKEVKEQYLRDIKEYQDSTSCQVLLKKQTKGLLEQIIGRL